MKRFTDKFKKRASGCWEWTACLTAAGYGKLGFGKKTWLAHRFSYTLYVGEVPVGMTLDHLCRNRKCVNPKHLEPVTQRVNALRGISPAAMQAKQTHCKRGHSLEGSYRYGNRRMCRVCRAAAEQARRDELKTLFGTTLGTKLTDARVAKPKRYSPAIYPTAVTKGAADDHERPDVEITVGLQLD